MDGLSICLLDIYPKYISLYMSISAISPLCILYYLPSFFLAAIESRRRHYDIDIAYRLIDARYQQLDQLHMSFLACKQLQF